MLKMNDWHSLFAELFEKAKQEGKLIANAVQNNARLQSDLFDPALILTPLDARDSLRGRPGVYVFIMTEDVLLTRNQVQKWDELDKQTVSAGIYPWADTKISRGQCLYLGKSKESLMQRLGHHFGPTPGCAPKGLALNHPSRIILKDKVRVAAFPIKNEFKDCASLLLDHTEAELHNILKPIAGQR